jgi:hypothetical protein
MSISKVLFRFFAIYLALMILVAIAFSLLGIKPNSGFNVAILIGAVMWPCYSFGMKLKRYFTASEKSRVVWGMIAINIAIQFAFASMVMLGQGKPAWGALALGVAFVGLIHSLVIVFFVGLTGKTLMKEFEKQAKARV